MNTRRYGRLSFVAGVLTFAVTGVALFSLAQQEPMSIVEAPPEMLAELTTLPPAVVPSPACPNCYTNDCPGCYHIFEKVPGTPYAIGREIPNPAPLEPGEVRPDFDPETGLPIWYIGHQPFVGPTDEEPISPELPIAKIELERIQARHDPEIFSIPGVHGFGIGAKGFIVFLDPKHSESASRIPKELEGIPVEVTLLGGPAVLRSHQRVRYRPVPLGAGVGRVLISGVEGREGTIMAHIVRNQDSIGFCCVINTLTAGHVMKHPEDALPTPGFEPPTVQPGPLQAASAPWGFFIKGFVQTRCDPNCTSPSAPLNTSAGNPDVAVIAHVSPDPLVHTDPLGHTSPPNTDEPIRRMQYTATGYVNGPSGVIQIASMGTSLKMWGVMSDAPKGPLIAMNVTQFFTDHDPVHGNRQFNGVAWMLQTWKGMQYKEIQGH